MSKVSVEITRDATGVYWVRYDGISVISTDDKEKADFGARAIMETLRILPEQNIDGWISKEENDQGKA